MWHEPRGEIGVPVLYKHGRKLVGDHTAKSWLLRTLVSESQFADDLVMYSVTLAMFELAGRRLIEVGNRIWFDLSVSPKLRDW